MTTRRERLLERKLRHADMFFFPAGLLLGMGMTLVLVTH